MYFQPVRVRRGEVMRKLVAALIVALIAGTGAPAKAADAKTTDGGVCPRPASGSVVARPADLYSANNVLNVTFNYYTSVDDAGRTLFCFATPDGAESPTLHVNPGDTLNVTLNNMIPPPVGGPAEMMFNTKDACGDTTMTLASANIHFHGTNVAPKCHSDEVIHTLVNSGESFTYKIKFPTDEPPGLYWYHPHVHTLSDAALQGGASGIIEVEGIANLQPAVSGLPERVLVFRDQAVANQGDKSRGAPPQPGADVSLNYVPVSYPDYPPAVIQTNAVTQEFWRFTNASSDTVADLQVVYDGKPQKLQIVALDGVPTGSQDGKGQGTIVTQKDILVPPAGRAEFIVTTPSSKVKSAQFLTETIDTGHFGDYMPQRVLATINNVAAPIGLPKTEKRSGPPNAQRFENLEDAKVTTQRLLYFSEVGGFFYITVDGANPVVFDPNNPPAITTTQGAVEEWTVQNRTAEVHEFHIHQIHFLLEAVNGVAIRRGKRQFYDTVQVPYWVGGGSYPSVTMKMDFRGPVIGDFVYHCHILKHEDRGMMAIIRVQKPAT
jgi:FtsP/CotA-like multicopper oxidase with cupredoxin domain